RNRWVKPSRCVSRTPPCAPWTSRAAWTPSSSRLATSSCRSPPYASSARCALSWPRRPPPARRRRTEYEKAGGNAGLFLLGASRASPFPLDGGRVGDGGAREALNAKAREAPASPSLAIKLLPPPPPNPPPSRGRASPVGRRQG